MIQEHKPYKTPDGRTLSEADWQRFFGDEGLWKNTLHPQDHDDEPTINTIVYYHQEEVQNEDWGEEHGFYITHVRGFPHGKGFMPRVRHRISSIMNSNGGVAYGTGDDAYEKARAEGAKMVREADDENRRLQEEIDQLAQKR